MTERLALLWEVLIPPSARAILTGNECERLFIVPDGKLNALPFDALVVENGEQPKYLVDGGPATIYAPSATVLVNLATRLATSTASAQPVLTVADAIYKAGAEVAGAPETSDQLAFTAQSRYWDGGGPLQSLPFTATESNWVAKNFKQHGIEAAGLRGALATEANVRANVLGREVLHFACHGLVDQRHGNFFGSLALTPGRATAGQDDDGYLTLPEIYSLKLSGCELAILSACQTNVGPQQRGEGLFGLSRGFLVAGSRRVVASNWLVDDESAASLVSYFSAGVAETQEKSGKVDYATSLHAARRWVRTQEKWSHPYYWATFVLIGPN
jgi:CHAT domain-containing protein